MTDTPGGSPNPRWLLRNRLFGEALEQPVELRAVWIAAACGDDLDLRQDVETLLQAHDDAGTFLDDGALAIPGAITAVIGATAGTAPAQPSLRSRFGDYRLVRELGRGGMGVVYLAERADDQFEKLVAIKVIAGDALDPHRSDRFIEERRILASLDHPGIARLLDAGASEVGAPYVVMEYVEGVPIDEYCRQHALSIRDRLNLFCGVTDAVQYSHERLVVHRDIKAGNILVTTAGAPKLLDFGIAKLLEPDGIDRYRTRTGFRALTPESASPEQIRGEPVTVSTDVYSLGVLLYRLLAGVSPYRGDMTAEAGIVRAICEEVPVRPSEAGDVVRRRDLRGDLDLITLKALHKDPARRYGSVEQLGRDIQRHLDRLPILAAPDAWTYRASKFVSRHWLGLSAAALVVISLLAGVIATSWQAHIARLERERADRRFNDVRRLANSFLFEFHDAIEPLPGSTKARELLVKRATEYLNSLAQESSDDPTLQRELGAAYEKVGDVQGLPAFANLGDTGGSLASHERALAIRRSLAATAPADIEIQRDLAITQSHIADLLLTTNNFPGALEQARQSLAIRQSLYERAPDDEKERRYLAIGYHYLSEIQSTMADWPAALDSVRRETSLFEAILASAPDSDEAQRNAAIAFKRLGGLLERSGDRATALENYRRSIALDERRVREHPADVEAKLDLSYGYASVGYALSYGADVAGSLENYGRALALREEAAAADVHDFRAQDTVARAHQSIGQVLRKAKRHSEAIEHFKQALEISSQAYAANATNGQAAQRMANLYGSLSGTSIELATQARRRAEAAPHWRNARTWAQKSLDLWMLLDQKGLAKSSPAELQALRDVISRSTSELK